MPTGYIICSTDGSAYEKGRFLVNKRKTIISVVCILLALVLIAGAIAYGVSPGRHTCSVYPVSDIAMTNYWGDDKSTYGEVRADKVQTVYLSSTQQVNDVFVTEGQSVLPGDKLMSYDTTLSEMEVTRKDLEIQQMKEQLTSAKKRYNTLAGSKVYSVSAPVIERSGVRLAAAGTPGYRLVLLADGDENYEVENYARHSGSGTPDDPFLYVCANGVPFGEDFLAEIGLPAPDPENPGNPDETPDPAPVYVVFGVSEDDMLQGKILQAGGMCFTRRGGDVSFIVFDASDYIGHAFGEPKPAPPAADKEALNKAVDSAGQVDTSKYTEKSKNALEKALALAKQVQEKENPTQAEVDVAAAFLNNAINALEEKSGDGGTTPTPTPSGAKKDALNKAITDAEKLKKTDYTSSSADALSAAIAMAKQVQSSSSATQAEVDAAAKSLNAAVKALVKKTGNNGSSSNSSSSSNSGNNGSSNSGTNVRPSNNGSSVTPNTGPSYAEIQAEKAELQQKIKDLDLKLRMAEVELKRMNQELNDGVVYAEMAGTITSVLSEDDARSLGEPVIKLAGGGGYQVQGTVNELDYDSVYVGQSVEVTSWESGQTFRGTVLEISDVPTDSAMVYGGGNMNVSYYPFLVRIEGEANLREYETLELKLETEHEQTDAFYLEQPFILQENGNNYVYVANEDGKLEKRKLTTGITLWGSSVQVLDGLTLEDNIAFPYGKNAREGAKAKLATLDELYMG